MFVEKCIRTDNFANYCELANDLAETSQMLAPSLDIYSIMKSFSDIVEGFGKFLCEVFLVSP
jgi:hypothetical protein